MHAAASVNRLATHDEFAACVGAQRAGAEFGGTSSLNYVTSYPCNCANTCHVRAARGADRDRKRESERGRGKQRTHNLHCISSQRRYRSVSIVLALCMAASTIYLVLSAYITWEQPEQWHTSHDTLSHVHIVRVCKLSSEPRKTHWHLFRARVRHSHSKVCCSL